MRYHLQLTGSINIFKKRYMDVFRVDANPIFSIRNTLGITLFIRLRGLNHLREHKYKYNYLDTRNPFCS